MRLPLLSAVLAMLLFAVPATAQSLKPDEIYSSIAVSPISDPNPVRGADGRTHLAYELLVVNPSKLFITLDRVEATDGDGRSLAVLEGERLTAMTLLYAGTGRTLPPGGTGVVFMDVSFAGDATPPPKMLGRITATRQAAGPDGRPAPYPKDQPFPATFTFTGAGVSVGKAAVVLAPPLKGSGWVAVNGCCDAITTHRGAVMTVNGRLRVPERFAIDWVKLDPSGRMFTGDIAKLASYAYYGTPVLAARMGSSSISTTAPTNRSRAPTPRASTPRTSAATWWSSTSAAAPTPSTPTCSATA